jgi:predicted  nucleic acid-binding Zn-ribbon protein
LELIDDTMPELPSDSRHRQLEKLASDHVRVVHERNRLTAELEQARGEHERLRRKAEAADRRVDRLESRLRALADVSGLGESD